MIAQDGASNVDPASSGGVMAGTREDVLEIDLAGPDGDLYSGALHHIL